MYNLSQSITAFIYILILVLLFWKITYRLKIDKKIVWFMLILIFDHILLAYLYIKDGGT